MEKNSSVKSETLLRGEGFPWVKVKNIPRNLTGDEVKEAFESLVGSIETFSITAPLSAADPFCMW